MKNQYKHKVLLCLFLIILWSYLNSNNFTSKPQNRYNLPDDNNGINIFVLAGQSNMAGRGGVENQVWDEIVPLECSSNKRILMMNENSELEEAKEPLHAGIDVNKTCGVGPGMAFANAILNKTSKFGSIVLVPGAVGGTSIREWSGPNSGLRNRLVKRTLDAVRLGGKIRAILWYQGEKDTESEEGVNMYQSEYQGFVRSLYCELGNPQVPFIQVALASG
ncbi:hypothetical protein CASFOL_019324 [Castilleja foliolosa]|uniref:Sialate O-acetylesterase domain-containing protein n=1 Tax=Castilleja foliolosa TaxID=1961234 RepID=A0ABD3D418_9LAMI